MNVFSFDKGPCLFVCIRTSNTKILKISLALSNHFSSKIEGPCDENLCRLIHKWLLAYQNHQELCELPLETSLLTPFRKKVLMTLLKTSFGQTLSYKKLAERSLSPKASRAVGTTCKYNPFPLVVPCHRVICNNGQLGEYNGGIEIKKRLLLFEKAVF